MTQSTNFIKDSKLKEFIARGVRKEKKLYEQVNKYRNVN